MTFTIVSNVWKTNNCKHGEAEVKHNNRKQRSQQLQVRLYLAHVAHVRDCAFDVIEIDEIDWGI